MEKEELNSEEGQSLLRLAREAICNHLDRRSEGERSSLPGLQEKRGLFVTLHKKGYLAGCMGCFRSEDPLIDTVKEMALSAAFRDPRFESVIKEDLEEIDIEISILSPLREIKDVNEISVGTHGIYITKGMNRGVLLPQVAMEQGWDRDTFLAHTCLKAGLPEDGWKERAKIEIFSAQIFGEKENETGE